MPRSHISVVKEYTWRYQTTDLGMTHPTLPELGVLTNG